MKVILSARDLRRSYRIGRTSLDVLKGVSLDIHEGETLSIMGESGSGKSTLLHVLGGLDAPQAGQVVYKGDNIYTMPASKRARFRAEHVGFVFQSFHLLPELDLLENVALPTMASRVRSDGTASAQAMLGHVGLEERGHHRPRELSGGEQQRAAIARALINEPQIIFADEPTGNLDSATGEKVLNYLFQLVQTKGHSLVLVTHSREVASRCSRGLELRDGVLL